MSKLSFRARALDPSKPMPIFLAEELPDLPEYSAINRAVPQMPSGMEKEEESEHHLQRAICTGLIIPTPEVFDTEQKFYDRNYPPDYKMPKQYIHMQPLALEQDIPDYDMDSADESWVNSQSRRLDLTPFKFEQMMDRLEKSSGQTVVTLNEAKALLKQDDEVSIAVYDYWLNKRLKTQHPLILSVKTENRPGTAQNNPYLAFRRRTEKMQTRKNRKNDESSYEKMLKLRRDLSRAVTLLEMIKRREKAKREQLHLGIEILEKRYQARDFSGQLLAEFSSTVAKNTRPAFAPIYTNQYSHSPLPGISVSASNQWPNSSSSSVHHYTQPYVNTQPTVKREIEYHIGSGSSRKEKRQYKKRKHKSQREKSGQYASSPGLAPLDIAASSEDEEIIGNVPCPEVEDEGCFAFRRNKTTQYHKPTTEFGNWPWNSKEENGLGDPKYRYTLTSIRHPRPRCIGFARKRVGRGGRIVLDRTLSNLDDFWSNLDYTIFDSDKKSSSLPSSKQNSNKLSSLSNCNNNNSIVIMKQDINENKQTSEQVLLRTSNNNINNKCNNVIKNNNNININNETTLDVKKEKLDEYGYDNMNSSSVLLINKSNISSVNSNNGLVYQNNKNPFILNNQQSILSSDYSSSGVTIKNEPMDIDEELTNKSVLHHNNHLQHNHQHHPPVNQTEELSITVNTNYIDNSTNDLIDEINNEWLHFRPKTPPPPVSPTLLESNYNCYIDDLELTESTPIYVEIQTLDNQLPSTTLYSKTYSNDNLFLSSVFSLADVLEDPFINSTSNSYSSNSLNNSPVNNNINSLHTNVNHISSIEQLTFSSNKTNELNSSGDSLNELNLSLGDTNDDHEKMLDNILQECEIEDLKSFHTNTNFWNGILEDTGLLSSLDIIDECSSKKTDNVINKIGYNNNEYVNNIESRVNKNINGRNKKYNWKIGHSSYNVVNYPKEEVFKKDVLKSVTSSNTILTTTTTTTTTTTSPKTAVVISNNCNSRIVQHNDNGGDMIVSNNIESKKIVNLNEKFLTNNITSGGIHFTTQQPSINSILVQTNPVGISSQQLPTILDKQTTENMIVLASPIRKHVNGPNTIDRNALQNMFKHTINVRKISTPLKKDDESLDIKPSKDMDAFVKVSLSDYGLTTNNLGLVTTSQLQTANSNHSYSLPPNSIQHHQQNQSIIVTGQPIQQNKIIINSTPSSSQSGSTIATTSNIPIPTSHIQELLTQSKIFNPVPTSNIKLNLVQSSNNQDVKNLIATSLHHPNLIVDNKSNIDVKTIVTGSSQQPRITKMEKTVNMLYDSDKNRILYTNIKNRGQFLAQINQKVVNLLPIQHSKNNTTNLQTLVTASPTTTIINQKSQTNQRLNNNSNTNSQTTINSLNNIRIQQSDTSNVVTKIIQSNDNPTVTGININTTNR